MMRAALLGALALAFALPAGQVAAQETDTDVPQRFWLEVGGFRATTQTNLRLNGADPGDDVNFERDLNLPGRRPRPTWRASGVSVADTR